MMAASNSDSWAEDAANIWASLPIASLEKSDPAMAADLLAAGMAIQCVKYGKSVIVSWPQRGVEPLAEVLKHLHFSRMMAVRGGVAAPWMNTVNMVNRPYLVVWTKPLKRYRQLNRDQANNDLHVHRVRKVSQMPQETAGLKTLLVDCGDEMLSDLEWLLASRKVFAFVIDAQPDGIPTVASTLRDTLATCAPDIPCLTVGTTGEKTFVDLLEKLSDNVWAVRPGDVIGWIGAMRTPHQPPAQKRTLSVLEDKVTDSHLEALTRLQFHLEKLASQGQKVGKEELLRPVRVLIRTLRALCVPLPVLEVVLTRHARGGPYPILPLETWREDATKKTWGHGDAQTVYNQLVSMIGSYMSLMTNAESARMQAIQHAIAGAVAGKRRLLVLVGSQIEQEALFEWIEQSYELLEQDLIRIAGMDGDAGHNQTFEGGGDVLIAGLLWPSRMHWLGMPCQNMTVLCYPYERLQFERWLNKWWGQHGAASLAQGSKRALWNLNFSPSPRKADINPDSGAKYFDVTSLPLNGKYSVAPKVSVIEHPSSFEDWLSELGEDLPDSERAEDQSDDLNIGYVLLTLQGVPQPVKWPIGKVLMVMRDTEYEPMLPIDIQLGDRVFQVHEGPDRLATQRSLFDLFTAGSFDYQQCELLASRWKRDLRALAGKLGRQPLFAKLKKNGLAVNIAAMDNWLRSNAIIGPQKASDLKAIGLSIDHCNPTQYATRIYAVCEKIRQEHRQIGKDLTAAIIERGNGSEVVRIGTHEISTTDLDQLFHIVTVEGIEVVTPVPESVAEIMLDTLRDAETSYPTRIEITGAARRSLAASPYSDAQRLRKALEFAANTLYDMLAGNGVKPAAVVEQAKALQIDFVPNTSASTMGKHKQHYQRQYNGNLVTIGAHLGLGDAFDPAKTLRIHYHFDDAQKKLILHHVGRHLPTSSH